MEPDTTETNHESIQHEGKEVDSQNKLPHEDDEEEETKANNEKEVENEPILNSQDQERRESSSRDLENERNGGPSIPQEQSEDNDSLPTVNLASRYGTTLNEDDEKSRKDDHKENEEEQNIPTKVTEKLSCSNTPQNDNVHKNKVKKK